jgi:rhodanese-related sulfurtransferase
MHDKDGSNNPSSVVTFSARKKWKSSLPVREILSTQAGITRHDQYGRSIGGFDSGFYDPRRSLIQMRTKPNDEIVLPCKSGARSARALHLLQEAGFRKLYNLEGGINFFSAAGGPAPAAGPLDGSSKSARRPARPSIKSPRRISSSKAS